jgi:hypothetical protein
VISTRDLSLLPEVERLKSLLQSMAMLDGILCPEWQYRYYSFNAHWGEREMMGSMRNGSGDDFFAWFAAPGCLLKGFAHEAIMASQGRVWPGVFEQVPPEFLPAVKEPAFKPEDTTFCIWRSPSDSTWQCGKVQYPSGDDDPDGSRDLLSPLDTRPETYQKWAEEYYELPVDLAAVREIYQRTPLSIAMVRALNPDLSLEDLRTDLDEIGYPSA